MNWHQIGKSAWRLTYDGDVFHVIFNLHVGSPKVPNWICTKANTNYYLQGSDQSGYETAEEAKKVVEKIIK